MLYLGNITFGDDSEKSTIQDDEALEMACKLLGINRDATVQVLNHQRIVIGTEQMWLDQKPVTQRDELHQAPRHKPTLLVHLTQPLGIPRQAV